jgi:hypothetical protein
MVPLVSVTAAAENDWYDAIDGYHSLNGPYLIGEGSQDGRMLDFPNPGCPIIVNTGTNSFPLLELRETELYALDSDGHPVSGTDFQGWQLNACALDGAPVTLRINQVSSAPDARCDFDPQCIHAYLIDQFDGTDWVPLCQADGVPISAVPVVGSWNDLPTDHAHYNPNGMTFVCLNGAPAKCLYYHRYLPWLPGGDQNNLWQSCIRMIRADYCGDGRDHTLGGTQIISGDFLTPPQHVWVPGPDTPDSLYEADWGPNGAECVNAVRHDELLQRCGVERDVCAGDFPFQPPNRILKNRCEPVGSPPSCTPLPY